MIKSERHRQKERSKEEPVRGTRTERKMSCSGNLRPSGDRVVTAEAAVINYCGHNCDYLMRWTEFPTPTESRRDQGEGGELDSHEEASPEESQRQCP